MAAIYHITHIDNLAGIGARGELVCDTLRRSQGIRSVGIAHAHIKDRRTGRLVAVAPNGCLADYVPFHFCPRSPMLFSIHGGFVDGYAGGQSAVVHLVSSTERVADSTAPFCFTDGHALLSLSIFHNDLARLDRIDWPLMENWSWRDTQDDPDRKRRKQAEFLVWRRFDWRLIDSIGVIDEATAHRVDAILASMPHRPRVDACRHWYY